MRWVHIWERVEEIFPDITAEQRKELKDLIDRIASDAASDAYSAGQGGGMRHPLDMS